MGKAGRRTGRSAEGIAYDHAAFYFVRYRFHRTQHGLRDPKRVAVFALEDNGASGYDWVCFECVLWWRGFSGMHVRQEGRLTDEGHSSSSHFVWSQPHPSTYLDLSLRMSGSASM